MALVGVLVSRRPPTPGRIRGNHLLGGDGVTRVPRTVEPIVVDLHPGEVLLIGTDGFGDPLGTGEGGVGNLFRQLLGQARPPSQLEFAHALDFSREAFDDDRTLVAVWPPESRNTQGDMW